MIARLSVVALLGAACYSVLSAREAAKPAEAVNALLDQMVLPVTGRNEKRPPLLMRARSRASDSASPRSETS